MKTLVKLGAGFREGNYLANSPFNQPDYVQNEHHGAHDNDEKLRLSESAPVDFVRAERIRAVATLLQLRVQQREPAHSCRAERRLVLGLPVCRARAGHVWQEIL